MKLFDDIVSMYETKLTESQKPTFDRDKLEAVRDVILRYQAGIEDSTFTPDQQLQYEKTIERYFDDMAIWKMDQDEKQEHDKVASDAYGLGAIDHHSSIPAEIVLVVESYGREKPKEVSQAFRTASMFLDSGVDPKTAIDRAITFTAKKHRYDDLVKFKYKFKDAIVDILKRVYPSMMFEHNLTESALPKGGEIADKKSFDPEDPEVYVYGYGKLLYSQIREKVARELDRYSSQVKQGNYKNVSNMLDDSGNGVLARMVAALESVDRELSTPGMKRKITLMKRKQEQ